MTQDEWNWALNDLKFKGCRPTQKAEKHLCIIDAEHTKLMDLLACAVGVLQLAGVELEAAYSELDFDEEESKENTEAIFGLKRRIEALIGSPR